jgi:hypothetical protein
LEKTFVNERNALDREGKGKTAFLVRWYELTEEA